MAEGLQHKADRIEVHKRDLHLVNSRMLIRAPQIMEHFCDGAGALNSWVPQPFVTTEAGSGTPYVGGATGDTVAIGVTGGTTNNAEELAGKGVLWTPSTMATNQRLVLEVRAKFVGATTAADGDFGIGFSDAVTEASSLPYVVSTTSTLTTHAPSDAALFWYSSIPTSGALKAASGNNYIGAITTIADVDTVTASTKQKDSNFHIYRVEIDSNGHAWFYYDDALVMTVASAVTAATALTPYIVAIAKNSHTNTATIDYIYVGGDYV